MIPRISKPGHSFKGAGLYYLHDKKAQTSERVTFTETINLPTNDADMAIRHMIDTATHSDQLKLAAGLKVTKRGTKPVYCYSLAWSPDQTPSRDEQRKAAYDTLKLLGLEEHQAMIIGHNDTDHPHIHIMVNRVHPETGLFKKMGNDKLKLSAWAESLEKEQGHIYCEERVKNNAARGNRFVKDQSPSKRQYYQVKKAASDQLWKDYRSERDQAKGELREKLDGLWQWRQNAIKAKRVEVKRYFKPQWRAIFKHQAKEVLDFDKYFLKRFEEARNVQKNSLTSSFAKAMFKDAQLRKDLLAKQKSHRMMLSNKQRRHIEPRVASVNAQWEAAKDKIYVDHKRAQKARLEQTKATSDKIWKDESMTPQRRLEQHQSDKQKPQDKSKTLEDAFNQEARAKRYSEAAKQAKKRKRSKERKRYLNKDDDRTRGR